MPGPVIQAPQLPWWADPKGASVMDPLTVSLARRATSALGLDDPQGQAMQAATGPLGMVEEEPGALVKILVDMLDSYKASDNPISPLGSSVTGHKVPSRTYGYQLLRSLMERNPDVSGKLETPLAQSTLKRPEGMWRIANNQARVNGIKPLAPVVPDLPSVTSPSELANIVKPIEQAPQASPQLIGQLGARFKEMNQLYKNKMARSGLNEDIIRNARKMTLDEAMKAYPNVNKSTLSDVVKRHSWGFIPD